MTHSSDGTRVLTVGARRYRFFSLDGLAVERLPFSLRVLLENLLRHEDGRVVTRAHVDALLAWDPGVASNQEIAFHPARVLLQDFTGVPAVVDLAAMREAFARLGGDPSRINPQIPVDLVIDHSVQVDHFGTGHAFADNVALELSRNHERYAFLRWGQGAFERFRVVPPGTGICHQVNLEHLARVVFEGPDGLVYPDTLVGTDSHTTMINGLGVLGWGVGGIEAEAAMLGQPVTMLLPEVVGFRLHGRLPEGTTATDVVLTITEMLRKKGVVGKFVEFFGTGLSALSLPDRATIANMAPEYGATMGFFPIDEETLAYLRFTGRNDAAELTEGYAKAQRLFRTDDTPDPQFSDVLALDLASVVPCLAGPKRPQDRVPLTNARAVVQKALAGVEGTPRTADALGHGSVVIAAITSCTNTSNPAVLVAAGLVAKKAAALGLAPKPWVKTSLAPGSRVVTDYLTEAGLLPHLEALGFHLVGYGCTTCIGNSGPLPEAVSLAVKDRDLVVASVLSGNRNFEGRVHPEVRLNFLASPPLVVAYALAGTVNLDPTVDPLTHDSAGNPVYLRDLWPTAAEVSATLRAAVRPEQFAARYASVFEGDDAWRSLAVPEGLTFAWDATSTYVRFPPFFEGLGEARAPLADLRGARCLALLGDSVTTDHISPAGNIASASPAAKYLTDHGIARADWNSYGARRGNHEVMVRGTFANIRLRNQLVPGSEGGVTKHLPDGAPMNLYDAAERYRAEGTPLVILAGQEYGTGSSRDWAAKGTALLGVRAVIAKSFERIHRSNLVGMGVLPLELDPGVGPETLGLTGEETFDVLGIAEGLRPKKRLEVRATAADGRVTTFPVTCRIDTPNELDFALAGGILPFVLLRLAAEGRAASA